MASFRKLLVEKDRIHFDKRDRHSLRLLLSMTQSKEVPQYMTQILLNLISFENTGFMSKKHQLKPHFVSDRQREISKNLISKLQSSMDPLIFYEFVLKMPFLQFSRTQRIDAVKMLIGSKDNLVAISVMYSDLGASISNKDLLNICSNLAK